MKTGHRRRLARAENAPSRLAFATLLLVVACAGPPPSGTPGPVISASPVAASATPEPTLTATGAPSPTPAPSPVSILQQGQQPPGFVPGIRCDGPIGATDPVAIVLVNAEGESEGEYVLRDYADVANPRTVCQFDSYVDQLLDARHVVVTQCGDDYDCIRAVVDLPEVRYHWFTELVPVGGDEPAEAIAVSPGQDAVVWSQWDADGIRGLYLIDRTGVHRIMDLAEALGRCSGPDDSSAGNFTRSGELLYVLDQPTPEDNTLAVLRGSELLFSLVPPKAGWPDFDEPSMPVWSPAGDQLFYRYEGGVWRWTPNGGATSYLPGIVWRYPTISPDGKHLAYVRPRPDRNHDVYLVDLAAGTAPVRIGRGRTTPVFLNDRQLWMLGEGDTGGCTGGDVQRRLVFDLVDGSEATSDIFGVQAVWPATSSSF